MAIVEASCCVLADATTSIPETYHLVGTVAQPWLTLSAERAYFNCSASHQTFAM